MNLEDLKPQPTSLEINGQEYQLRPINLEDEAWLRSSFTDGEVEKALTEQNDMDTICRIVYRFIVDKTDFKKREVTVIDEEGEEEKMLIGGWKLLLPLVSGVEQKALLFQAIYECVGLGRVVKEFQEQLDKCETPEELEEKKSQMMKNLNS